MKRSAEEQDELNRQFKKAMQQKMTELLPDNVQERLPDITDQLLYYILTGNYQKAGFMLTNARPISPGWIYAVYIAMKGMEQYLNVDTEMFFQKYRIWIILLRALNDFNYQKLVDMLKNDFGIQKYSPRWLFWSAVFLNRSGMGIIRQYSIVKWIFKHTNNQDIRIIEYNPENRKLTVSVLNRPPEFDIDNQLTIPDIDFVMSTMMVSSREFVFRPDGGPEGKLSSEIYFLTCFLYQIFRLGYTLNAVHIGKSKGENYDIRCSICSVEQAKFTCQECPNTTKLCGKCAENH